eukprot:jgi/Botrbrau1/16837/Bobra.150_2s0061.1
MPRIGGLGVLDWTGRLIPQGMLVKGAKAGWYLAWQTMMKELAPQQRDGSYSRPKYSFNNCIGTHPSRQNQDGVREGESGYVGRCTAPLLVDRLAGTPVCNESSELAGHAERSPASWQLPSRPAASLPPASAPGPERAHLRQGEQRGVQKRVRHNTEGLRCRHGGPPAGPGGAGGPPLHLPLPLGRQTDGGRTFDCIQQPYALTAFTRPLFKCCWRRLADYPNLNAWMRDFYHIQVHPSRLQVKDSFSLDDARRSYFSSLVPAQSGRHCPGRANHRGLGAGTPLPTGTLPSSRPSFPPQASCACCTRSGPLPEPLQTVEWLGGGGGDGGLGPGGNGKSGGGARY